MRFRLLFDTGFDTIEKITVQEPVEMRDRIMIEPLTEPKRTATLALVGPRPSKQRQRNR
jgi:hypothetical protein